MRLASVRTPLGPRAAVLHDGELIEIGGSTVEAFLAEPDWQRRRPTAGAATHDPQTADLGPVVSRPGKVICVGLNYRAHIHEMGRDEPDVPTLFAKFADTLLGPFDPLCIPPESTRVDWEAELGVVIGAPARRVSATDAVAAIAGFTIVNDVSMRDWQRRTLQWLQGKAWDRSTPVGPHMVTLDEFDNPADLAITCVVNGATKQSSRTSDLVFDAPAIVSYISQFTTLQPGDLIATGTPGGVGDGADPQVYLHPGDVMVTTIEGIGSCTNTCV
jgi:acylpyruvate hydrolase